MKILVKLQAHYDLVVHVAAQAYLANCFNCLLLSGLWHKKQGNDVVFYRRRVLIKLALNDQNDVFFCIGWIVKQLFHALFAKQSKLHVLPLCV